MKKKKKREIQRMREASKSGKKYSIIFICYKKQNHEIAMASPTQFLLTFEQLIIKLNP